MNTKKLYAALIAAAFIIGCLPGKNLSAQTGVDEIRQADESFQLVLNDQLGTEDRYSSRQGVVEPVSVRLTESLPFTIQVPRSKAGYRVMVGDLDGGQMNAIINQREIALFGNETPPNVTVSDDGLVDFSFQPGNIPGLYRIMVTIGVDQYQLQFYVVDPNRPARPQH